MVLVKAGFVEDEGDWETLWAGTGDYENRKQRKDEYAQRANIACIYNSY